MRLKSFLILISIVLVPLFSATSFDTDKVEETTDPTVCIEGVSGESSCITPCCYVIYDRSYDDRGNQLCESGGTTHCSECCLQDFPLPGEG